MAKVTLMSMAKHRVLLVTFLLSYCAEARRFNETQHYHHAECCMMAAEGARVAFCARDADGVAAAEQELRAAGAGAAGAGDGAGFPQPGGVGGGPG